MLKQLAAGGGLVIMAALASSCGKSAQVQTPGPIGPSASRQTSITDGESLIRAMHDRYAGKWYHTMTFVQTTTITRPSQTPVVQTWYEALSLPGKLRIDVGNPGLGNGTMFRADSTYTFADGQVTRAESGFNPLLVLGFDVYAQPPEQTISILRNLGYLFSRLHTDDLDGKAVYVVGATSRFDSTSKQFWVERDRLIFVKGAEKNAGGNQTDVRFMDYVKAGDGWVARQVWQFVNGSPRVHEQYADIKTDVPLDSALFDPKRWKTAPHWIKP